MSSNGPITRSLESEGFEVITVREDSQGEAGRLAAVIAASDADHKLLVVDSSRPTFYSEGFQMDIRDRGILFMMITFRSTGHFNADVVHNQNLFALRERYSTEAYTRLLLGPRYVILDERFVKLRRRRKASTMTPAETVLVYFGGADTSHLTLTVLRSLASLESRRPRRIITVVGPLHGRLDEITTFARANPALPIDLHIDTAFMPELLAEADIAVTSGGLTTWELACLGIPHVVLATSERERTHTPLLEERGTCLYLGHQNQVTEPLIRQAVEGLMADSERRAAMSAAGGDLVDGHGTGRVIEHMIDLLIGGSVVAETDDGP